MLVVDNSGQATRKSFCLIGLQAVSVQVLDSIRVLEKSTVMKKRTTSILFLVILVAAVGVGYYFAFFNLDKMGNIAADNAFGWKYPVAKFPVTGPNPKLSYSSVRNSEDSPHGLPVRLRIPAIGVDSAIEDAVIDPSGRMDVPAGSVNVAWFALGPPPGQVGSAVIGGHFGIHNGVSFVFYDLDKLRAGDRVYIVDDTGKTLTFIVRSSSSFDRNADATAVFTSSDNRAHLNLVTCEGIWNQVRGSYPQRLVVFTDAVPTEGAAAAERSEAFFFELPTIKTYL